MSGSALKARVLGRLVADGPGGRLRERVTDLVAREGPLLAPAEQVRIVGEVLAEVCGLGPLEPILADPDVTEVMVNGPGRVWVERAGRLERVPVALDTAAIEHLIEKVVAPLGLRIDRSSPLVDARLADGSRVNAVVPPLAVDGPCLTVRRFGARAIPLAAFGPPPVVALLAWAVAARFNILVSGGTGAGKTTLLNALAGCIPDGERVVTVEDAAELRLPGDHVVRLEARPPNAEGAGEVRIRELVRNALRMRPDRIVVGEVRGPEALDMLQAMNTGHEVGGDIHLSKRTSTFPRPRQDTEGPQAGLGRRCGSLGTQAAGEGGIMGWTNFLVGWEPVSTRVAHTASCLDRSYPST